MMPPPSQSASATMGQPVPQLQQQLIAGSAGGGISESMPARGTKVNAFELVCDKNTTAIHTLYVFRIQFVSQTQLNYISHNKTIS